jgi:hypothetical protein
VSGHEYAVEQCTLPGSKNSSSQHGFLRGLILVILHEQMGEAAMRLTPTTLRNVMLSIAVQPSQYGSVGRNGEPALSAGGDLAMECC